MSLYINNNPPNNYSLPYYKEYKVYIGIQTKKEFD